MKKLGVYSLIVLFVFSLVLIIPFRAYAYPLDAKETMLSQRTLPNGEVQVFTKKDNKTYVKTFIFSSGNWILENTKSLILHKTGLIQKGTEPQTDPNLSNAIETKLKASGINLGALPSLVDYSSSPYLPPVGQQEENDCVAWATSYYLRTYQEAKDLGWNVIQNSLPLNSHVFSPSFIYNQINGGQDSGSALEDAGDLLETVGDATLTDFPYVPGDYLSQPTITTIQSAYVHRIKQWRYLFTLKNTSDYIIQQTKEYLNTGDLPVVGVNAGYNYEYPEVYNGKSFITYDNTYIGGHALTVVGYDDNIETPDGQGAFKVINSWSNQWGDSGFGYITYQEFIKSAIEGVVYTDLVNGRTVDALDPTSIKTVVLSPTQAQYTWSGPINATGYKIFDQSFNLVANVNTTQYIEKFAQTGIYTRYIEAYNSVSADDPVKFTVDLTNAPTVNTSQLPVKVENSVQFNIQFNGGGTYNISIQNSSGNVIYSTSNSQTSGGATTLQWSGNDSVGNPAPDGQYSLNITNVQQQTIYSGNFTKQGRVSAATAEENKLNNVIQSVDVNLTPASDGNATIDVNNSGVKTVIATNLTLKAGQPFDYMIPQSVFDFNNVDFTKALIEINVQ